MASKAVGHIYVTELAIIAGTQFRFLHFSFKNGPGCFSGKASEKAEPKVPKSDDEAKKLIKFMENHYDQFVAGAQSFDDFYHAIFELIQMFCEERGQLQYKILEKETLLNAYNKHHKSSGELKKEEFVAMSMELVGVNSFSVGNAAMEFAMILFGVPVCAALAKRVLPGLGWLSDDVVVPLATSGSVAYLIRSKRL